MEDTSGVHLWLVLSKAAHQFGEHARRSIADTGLGLSDFAALEALLHKGPLTIGVIAEKVLLTSGSMTTAVDRLEKRGLVKRGRDPGDRRGCIVRLTAPGRKLIRSAFACHAEAMQQAASAVTSTERATLLRLLRKLGKVESIHPEALA